VRTTVTLADDVAAAVERLRRERGLGLSDAVNELARAELRARGTPRSFRQKSARLGLKVDVTDVAEALDFLEAATGR
jgi:Arc/MetJ family transcription regulator